MRRAEQQREILMASEYSPPRWASCGAEIDRMSWVRLVRYVAFTVIVGVGCAAEAIAGSNIVAQAAGYTLSADDLDDEVAVFEIALGKTIPQSDVGPFRALLVSDFDQHPQPFAQGLTNFIHPALQMRHDPFGEARVRELVWESMSRAKAASSIALFREMERITPVLASSNDLVVTQRQVSAYFDLVDSIATVAKVARSSPSLRAQFARTLPARFASMDRADQLALGQAEIRSEGLEALLNSNIGEAALPIRREIQHCVRSIDDAMLEARSLGTAGLKYEFSVGQLGPAPGENSSDLNARVWASVEKTSASASVASGEAFWPSQPCGHS